MQDAHDELRDALAAIDQVIAAEGIHPDSVLAEQAHDRAVEVIRTSRGNLNTTQGTLRQFTYRAIQTAARVGIARRARQQSRLQPLPASIPQPSSPQTLRFTQQELARLPPKVRRAVVLHVHVGLSLRDTGLLLGGVNHSIVKAHLHRAAILLNLIPSNSHDSTTDHVRQI